MQLYLTNSTNPYRNLAIEEYLLRHSTKDCFLLWQNEPTVVIGKNQNYYSEVREEEIVSRGIHVARRITGGGAVYHDLGNINYSFITSRDKAQVLDFAFFTQPMIEALDSIGIKATLSGRNDLLVSPDGINQMKVSGNAQTATEYRILHHGTLLFDSHLDVLSSVLKPAQEKLKSKGIASVRSRVTNLRSCLSKDKDMDVKRFFDCLCQFAEKKWEKTFDSFAVSSKELAFYEQRNSTEEYIKGRKQSYEYEKKVSFSGGKATILWSVKNEKIEAFRIEGDFFGSKPTEELEKILLHKPLTKDAIEKVLSDYPVSLVMHDLSNEEFMEVLFPSEM